MLSFILKRISYGILVLFGVVSLVFFLFNLLPGDPARLMLGQRADNNSIEIIRKDIGTDRPLQWQYLKYLNDVSPLSVFNFKDENSYFFFDKNKYKNSFELFKIFDKAIVIKTPYLRRSYQSKQYVSEIISSSFLNTFILAFSAMFFASIIGIFFGTVSAIKKDSWLDRTLLVLSAFGMSLPSFFAAILVGWIFAFVLGKYTGLNLTGNLYEIDDFGEGKFLNLKNLILPAFTLGIRPLAVILQLSRNSLLEVLEQDYIRTAKAKGLGFYKVIRKHALRNSLNPVLTSISGWFASLMAGVVFIEYIFGWKGLGYIIVDALNKYDLPVVMGCVIVISVIFIFTNIIVDMIYKFLDPRVKLN